ncbi:hypothetical protein [Vitiosangium sp. GDMCC 1.1324]|uniref:hypothetical protein n=1 Tax=Vitiosangium sp. (strain GDMCC 1.1324) TaxID=2138576 RepID=UPI000D33AB51|nr:hypothetical protein [Vitiosangium sp. GDMCC 1.1324]PTL82385.1 hypothetical protein DAT35_16325 [Vitiosangium sp. GDMCC 1.1324]
MSLRTFAMKALPWLAFALALTSLAYTWNWALAKASERHRLHQAFTTGTTKYIFGLCPDTPLVNAVPQWANDMRGFCRALHPSWGNGEQGSTRSELDIENGSTWQALQLLSRLVLEVSPAKVLSLLPLVVISLAGLLGLQHRGWLSRQGINPRLRVTRGAALTMLVVVTLALSASLVLLNEQETATMCQVTGSTYANLLSIDARCSQQTMLLRDTQALLEQKKGELDARARELEDLKHEIASLGAMRDALGTFKTELKSQSESTQQLIMAVTGATLDGINKAMDPLHKDVKGLDQSLKTDFKNDLRGELQGDMKALVRNELKAALQSEELKDVVRQEVRAAVQEDVRAVVRGELRESMKTVLEASHVPASAPALAESSPTLAKASAPSAAPVPAKGSAPAPAKGVPSAPPATRKPTPANPQGKPATPSKQPTAQTQGKH